MSRSEMLWWIEAAVAKAYKHHCHVFYPSCVNTAPNRHQTTQQQPFLFHFS